MSPWKTTPPADAAREALWHFAPGEHPFFPEGKADNSRLFEPGARCVVELFVREMMRQNTGFPALPRKLEDSAVD